MKDLVAKKAIYSFEVKSLNEDGTLSGYASVFDVVDHYRDVIVSGAFRDTIAKWEQKNQMPALLWQHNSNEPIGVITKLNEDSRGLYFEAKLAVKTQRGSEAYELLKMKALSGVSIGYSTVKESTDSEEEIRKLLDVDLWEISLVTFPANEAARVTQVKQKPRTVREMEQCLRDAGFSHREAKAAASAAFNAVNLRDEDSEHLEKLSAEVDRAIKILTT